MRAEAKENRIVMKTNTLDVSGMTCGGCTAKVTRALSALPGVAKVDVSLPKKAAEVTFDEALVSVDDMRAALRTAGYGDAAAPEVTSSKGCCS
jgi:copper chaperone